MRPPPTCCRSLPPPAAAALAPGALAGDAPGRRRAAAGQAAQRRAPDWHHPRAAAGAGRACGHAGLSGRRADVAVLPGPSRTAVPAQSVRVPVPLCGNGAQPWSQNAPLCGSCTTLEPSTQPLQTPDAGCAHAPAFCKPSLAPAPPLRAAVCPPSSALLAESPRPSPEHARQRGAQEGGTQGGGGGRLGFGPCQLLPAS